MSTTSRTCKCIFYVPDCYVGRVKGKHGTQVKRFEQEHGVSISYNKKAREFQVFGETDDEATTARDAMQAWLCKRA